MQIPWLSALAVGFVAIFIVLHGDVHVSSQDVLHVKYAATPGVVDLLDIHMPVLTGPALRYFAILSGVPVLGPLISQYLKRVNQMYQVRELAALVDDAPIYYPLHYPSAAERQHHGAQLTDLTYRSPTHPDDSVFFTRHSIQDYTDAYASGRVTPLQVARAVLAAIDASNTAAIPLRAVIAFHRDDILNQARASTARYAAGTPSGPLDGVPVLVKDETDVRGYNTTGGTSFIHEFFGPATYDALSVARMRRAGALVVGKTNLHEVGLGVTGLNNAHGATRNAFSSGHMSMGSSSGSAAAVAAGIVPLALGCDGGGSVRIPAAMNGVVGLKATFMRIPLLVRGAPSSANNGPIAATVQDIALAYAVLGGADADVPMSSVQPPVHVDLKAMDGVDLSHLRVGVFPAYMATATPEILAQYWTTVRHLESLGATLVNVTIPNLQAIHYSHSMTILGELAQYTDAIYDFYGLFSPEVQVSLRLSRLGFSSVDFVAAQVVRGYATRLWHELFESVDVFLTPTTPITAPELKPEYLTDGLSDLAMTLTIMRFVVLANLIGFPSLAVPMGYESTTGLPTSMLVQAAHWNEDVVLHVARVIEKQAPSHKPVGYYYDILEMAQGEDAT
ncbi:Aste57867_19125 [Aphanomyces stellatus]|uniref:Aste57867_19125 protein n=1 Tax=Aphanomyces stellatus TaxID=120398 RepID=A0A485LG35_9STRA|nr:hypothetical protein As57867_019061 [Aphanomyces stellatus]VFT95848.1 Aste57867_19125 [Aphanomyces stellatus]